jgi:PAS domain S-box-containing protein
MPEPYRVLIVDDDSEQARLVTAYLRYSGPFEVDWAESLGDLWARLLTQAYDMILLDYRLPDGTGLEALEEIRRRGEQVPVVLITGQGDERLAVQAIQLGAVDYLVKGSDYLPSLPALIQKSIRASELQSAIQRSHEQVRYQALLLNNVRDAVVVWDAHGRITYWNPAAEVLFDRKASECLGQKVEDWYLSAFDPAVNAPEREATEGREIERLYVTPGGKQIWVSSRVSSLRDYVPTSTPAQPGSAPDRGRMIGYMDVSRDITSRKKAESALRSERNFISAVLDTVGALVLVLDRQGNIVRFNRACEQVTGYSYDEVKGQPVWDLFFPPEERHQTTHPLQLALNQVLSGKYPVEYESQWLTRSRASRTIAWSNTALLDEQGRVKFMIATGIDITERKKAELALRQSSRMAAVGELASGVAHHINNPLTTIIAEAQLLRQSLAQGHAEPESVDAIERAGWRVQETVQQLIEFARPASNTVEQISVNQTIQSALGLVGEHIQSSGVSLSIQLEASLPPVQGNARRLTELWVSLLLLARDATSDGQRHAIQVRSWFEPSAAEARGDTGGQVCIEIFDDGRTITPVEMQDLFEPNFTQPAGGRGTGIELNLCQEIVRQHQGQIHAASSQGTGTTFTVRIPALEQTEGQPAPGG